MESVGARLSGVVAGRTLLSAFEAPAAFGSADFLTGNIREDAEVVKLRFFEFKKR